MTEKPVMAEIALTTAPFCFLLFRIFEAHRGSSIRKGGKQKYRRDQKRFLRHGEENAACCLFTLKMAETSFLLDIFCRIFFVLSIHGMDR
jgi:hypothetical protein